MPNKLAGKPCPHCGAMLQGVKRPERKSYYYPKTCESCRPLVGPRGENHPRWNGGRNVDPRGYVYVRDPRIDGYKRVLEHILVWEMAHGARPPGHHVHHVNHVRDDNRLENLVLMRAQAHIEYHHQPLARWALKHDQCVQCGTDESPHDGLGLCQKCALRKRWAKAKEQGKPWATPIPRMSAWAQKYLRCLGCESTDHPYKAKGLCKPCYGRVCDARRPPRSKH